MYSFRPADEPPPYTPYNPLNSSSRPGTPIQSINIQSHEPSERSSTSDLDSKSLEYRRSEFLAVTKMAASVGILLFGIISLSLTKGFIYYNEVERCASGTSIWTSILGIATASLGLWILRHGGKRILSIFHFVMSMMCAVVFVVLVVSSCICASSVYDKLHISGFANSYQFGAPAALLGFEICVILFGFINVAANFATVVYVCIEWCDKGEASRTATVVYLPRSQSLDGSDHGSIQAISVPQGSQVIFLPITSVTTQNQNQAVQPSVE